MDYIISEANKINAPKPTQKPTNNERKIGDVVNINGVYISSDSTNKLNPARTTGTITKHVQKDHIVLLLLLLSRFSHV